MARWVSVGFAAVLMAACAGAAGSSLDVEAMQRRLDERGVGFGVTGLPGEKAVLFQVRFKTSQAGETAPDMDLASAAALAAPAGCTVASITATSDGGARVAYRCP